MGSERSYDAVYSANRYKERKKVVNAIKLNGGCVDCGYNKHPAALQFDHVKGDKQYRISASLTCSWDTILKEIEKCQIRCANCHAIKTKRQRLCLGRPKSTVDASLERRRSRNRNNGRKKYQERRDVVDGIKMNKGCVDCGYNSSPEALQFDHIDPEEKKFKIAHAICFAWEVLSEEISKCDVRCANCHSIKTQDKMEMGRGVKEK